MSLVCDCGFKFAGPGEYRNCESFITDKGLSGVICPECDQAYIDGVKVDIDKWKERRVGR